MVKEQLMAGGIRDPRVLEAMAKIPRHLFVSPGMEVQSYLDRPLPIGDGQTISQPMMVALMSELLEIQPTHRLLEIGTGSGYQTAVLAELCKHVFTIERLKDLSLQARRKLYSCGYSNVTFRIGDGTLGWPQEAPFDGIIATAGAPLVPEALKDQLVIGGRLVIPVGSEETQDLLVLTRTRQGFQQERRTSCRFVKMIGAQGWR